MLCLVSEEHSLPMPMWWFLAPAGGDVQGLMNSGLKVHAIEQDEKQSQAMMANLRTYKPASQLWKLVPSTKFRGQVDPSAKEGKDEVLPVDIK